MTREEGSQGAYAVCKRPVISRMQHFLLKLFESSLTAGYNGPLRVKSAGKTRNHTHLHYPGRNDPDRYVSSTDHGNAGAGILDLLPEAMPSPGGFIRA
jgi:hypothetical protein